MPRALLIPVALLSCYLALAGWGLASGGAAIPIAHVVRILGHAIGIADLDGVAPGSRDIVLRLRLPQMILLGLVGAALACSGAALQATFENPLADPGILGITSGAALGAVLAIHVGLAERVFLALPTLAFAGAAAEALVVYLLARAQGRRDLAILLLTGAAVGSMCAAGVSLAMLLVEPYRVQELLFWLLGGVRNQTWEHVALAAPGVIVGCSGLLLLHRRLDALLLGEEQALAVGVPVAATRLAVLGLTALASGAATAVAGSIAFVGLLAPHCVRWFTGPNARLLLPASAAAGATFLTACELLSRSLFQTVPLHLGILTAFVGGPAFLVLLRQSEEPRP
jgi:iron complex transport system permease protein